MAQEKKISHCHKAVAKVAKSCCEASYDELMSQNLLYEAWKKSNPTLTGKRLRQQFVNQKWGLWIPAARATLTLLLRQPIDEKIKEDIMEILILDSTLIRGRVQPQILAGTVGSRN